MKSTSSEQLQAEPRKTYFCSEPWAGIFSIETNLDVTFCPCYLKLKIGNLNEASIREIWNAEPLVQLRRAFRHGELPKACQNQLCPVALGE
jgi:MoaA/NifB/PqqE/SkfB family radical SAM enzyme